MADYIKREDALEQFDYYDLGEYLTTQIRGMLMDIPSADVAPVRHGRWIETSYDEYQCSACKKVVREEILYAIKPSDREDASMYIANYCPICGAKMDEEDEDEID